jgi:hypothetical protein
MDLNTSAKLTVQYQWAADTDEPDASASRRPQGFAARIEGPSPCKDLRATLHEQVSSA